MRKVRRPLLVLHPDETFRERVRAASGVQYVFQPVSDWEALGEAVRGQPAPLVVVDPYTQPNGERGPSTKLRGLLAEFPSMAVLAAMQVVPERFDDLRTLGKWGVVQVISLGHDDTAHAIGQRLRAARGRPLLALLEQVLPPETSGRARAILEASVEVVAVGGHGKDLAESLHLSRRTLLRWSRRAALPAPRKLLAWMRVLLAAELLDDPGRSVLSVAHICGYSSDSGLRRITQKFLGSSPSELRKQGAFQHAAQWFLQMLAEQRRAERKRRNDNE
jgi:AraC-like DNA-binding protein